jgi:hypothetical protein
MRKTRQAWAFTAAMGLAGAACSNFTVREVNAPESLQRYVEETPRTAAASDSVSVTVVAPDQAGCPFFKKVPAEPHRSAQCNVESLALASPTSREVKGALRAKQQEMDSKIPAGPWFQDFGGSIQSSLQRSASQRFAHASVHRASTFAGTSADLSTATVYGSFGRYESEITLHAVAADGGPPLVATGVGAKSFSGKLAWGLPVAVVFCPIGTVAVLVWSYPMHEHAVANAYALALNDASEKLADQIQQAQLAGRHTTWTVAFATSGEGVAPATVAPAPTATASLAGG